MVFQKHNNRCTISVPIINSRTHLLHQLQGENEYEVTCTDAMVVFPSVPSHLWLPYHYKTQLNDR